MFEGGGPEMFRKEVLPEMHLSKALGSGNAIRMKKVRLRIVNKTRSSDAVILNLSTSTKQPVLVFLLQL
jgi:hypothetical protein